jgi:hypothetical protein
MSVASHDSLGSWPLPLLGVVTGGPNVGVGCGIRETFPVQVFGESLTSEHPKITWSTYKPPGNPGRVTI